jgi:hypothetical protein
MGISDEQRQAASHALVKALERDAQMGQLVIATSTQMKNIAQAQQAIKGLIDKHLLSDAIDSPEEAEKLSRVVLEALKQNAGSLWGAEAIDLFETVVVEGQKRLDIAKQAARSTGLTRDWRALNHIVDYAVERWENAVSVLEPAAQLRYVERMEASGIHNPHVEDAIHRVKFKHGGSGAAATPAVAIPAR